MNPIRREDMAVNAGSGGLSQPRFEILEHVGKAFEHRIGRGGSAVFPVLVRMAGLHVKTRTALGAAFNRLGEQAVNLARIGFGRCLPARVIRQEGFVKLARMGPDFPRDKAI